MVFLIIATIGLPGISDGFPCGIIYYKTVGIFVLPWLSWVTHDWPNGLKKWWVDYYCMYTKCLIVITEQIIEKSGFSQ